MRGGERKGSLRLGEPDVPRWMCDIEGIGQRGAWGAGKRVGSLGEMWKGSFKVVQELPVGFLGIGSARRSARARARRGCSEDNNNKEQEEEEGEGGGETDRLRNMVAAKLEAGRQ